MHSTSRVCFVDYVASFDLAVPIMWIMADEIGNGSEQTWLYILVGVEWTCTMDIEGRVWVVDHCYYL